MADTITYFAQTDARNKRVPFGIKSNDRTKHVYVIGKTGMGKSTLLENMAVQDIKNGEGFAFIDPHGKTAELLLEYIPEERIKDVIYFAPFDTDHPISFNVMEDVGYDKRHLVVSGLMSAFKKIFQDVASYLAHKKFKTIKTGNIPAWRKGVAPLVGYHGKGKGCRAMCSFVEEGDAISLEEYLHGTYLRQRSELKNKIALIE